MAEKNEDLQENRKVTAGYRFVVVWAVCILFLYVLGAFAGTALLRGYAADSAKIRQARLASPTLNMNAKAPEPTLPSSAGQVDVLVGGSINRIGEIALRESVMTIDFNLWFRWNSARVKPSEGFRLVNGQILQQENVESSRIGTEQYVEQHVVARMVEDIAAARFPFGEIGLFVQVEDKTQGGGAIRYVADKQGSGIGPEAMPRGIKLTSFLADTRIGGSGPRAVSPGGIRAARSQFILAMLVKPDGIGLYQKLFQALFASVAIAVIALFIKPTHVDCRFGLPVGGFFACISNNIFVGTLLPHADRLTLADMVNATGMFTIFLILVQSVISLHIYDTLRRERLAIFFDRVSFAVFLIGYVAVNLALPLAARPL